MKVCYWVIYLVIHKVTPDNECKAVKDRILSVNYCVCILCSALGVLFTR